MNREQTIDILNKLYAEKAELIERSKKISRNPDTGFPILKDGMPAADLFLPNQIHAVDEEIAQVLDYYSVHNLENISFYSEKLHRWTIGLVSLTVVLIGLTAILAYLTYLLWISRP